MLQVIAHRGVVTRAPENTLASFKVAMELNVAGIELDIHMTYDGHLVVIHDEKIDRTSNGSGYVKFLTLNYLKSLSFGGWFAPSFQAEKIPLLSEVFELVKASNLFLVLELKNNCNVYPGLELAVLKEIERFNFKDRVVISSFNHRSLFNISLYNSSYQLGILYSTFLPKPFSYAKKVGASFLFPYYKLVFPYLTYKFLKGNLKICPFTVNNVILMQSFSFLNVDAIITDNPVVALEVLKGEKRCI